MQPLFHILDIFAESRFQLNSVVALAIIENPYAYAINYEQ